MVDTHSKSAGASNSSPPYVVDTHPNVAEAPCRSPPYLIDTHPIFSETPSTPVVQNQPCLKYHTTSTRTIITAAIPTKMAALAV
jgi:hypothetical protein